MSTWTASAGATGYNIKRSLTNGGPYTTVATILAGSNYIDTAVSNGLSYYYEVTALNANGESLPSNQAFTSVPLPVLNGVYLTGGNSVKLSWSSTASPFNLLSTPSLMPPIAWSAVTNTVVNQSGTSSVTLPAGGSNNARFFRLAGP